MPRSGLMMITEGYLARNMKDAILECYNDKCKNGKKHKKVKFKVGDGVFKKKVGNTNNQRTVFYCVICALRLNHI